MKLFLAHCGFYDQTLAEGGRNIFESHHNFYVAASDAAEAKARVKEKALFKDKKMHVDGLHEISAVDGYRVVLEPEAAAGGGVRSVSYDEARSL